MPKICICIWRSNINNSLPLEIPKICSYFLQNKIISFWLFVICIHNKCTSYIYSHFKSTSLRPLSQLFSFLYFHYFCGQIRDNHHNYGVKMMQINSLYPFLTASSVFSNVYFPSVFSNVYLYIIGVKTKFLHNFNWLIQRFFNLYLLLHDRLDSCCKFCRICTATQAETKLISDEKEETVAQYPGSLFHPRQVLFPNILLKRRKSADQRKTFISARVIHSKKWLVNYTVNQTFIKTSLHMYKQHSFQS